MSDFATRRVLMVDTQVRPSDVTKFPIIEAMLAVPREVFVPSARREAAYVGENLDIAPGRVVLEPRTLAKLLDALDVQPGELVLDLGCGLGYSTAVIARLADAVVAVEEDEAMAAEAQRTLSAEGVDNAAVVVGPLAAGDARHAPFDVITIQGGVEVVQGLAGLVSGQGRLGRICLRFGLKSRLNAGCERAGHGGWFRGVLAWQCPALAAGMLRLPSKHGCQTPPSPRGRLCRSSPCRIGPGHG